MYITLYIITETIETTVCCVGLQYPCCTVCMCFANRVAWQCCMYDIALFVSFNDHVIQTAGSCQGKCPDKCVCLIGCECLPGQCVWKERLVQSEVMMLSLVLHFNIWQCVLCAWIAKGEVVGFCLNCQKQEVEGWLKTVWLQCDNYGRRIWIWWTNKVSVSQPAPYWHLWMKTLKMSFLYKIPVWWSSFALNEVYDAFPTNFGHSGLNSRLLTSILFCGRHMSPPLYIQTKWTIAVESACHRWAVLNESCVNELNMEKETRLSACLCKFWVT